MTFTPGHRQRPQLVGSGHNVMGWTNVRYEALRCAADVAGLGGKLPFDSRGGAIVRREYLQSGRPMAF